jgi:hypothetical protein
MGIWAIVGAMYYLEYLYFMATNPGAQCGVTSGGGFGCTGNW